LSVTPGTVFLDWLACAHAGADEPGARAARSVAEGVAGHATALGTAGHVLDFDDTFLPGLAHLSAPVAPAALAVAASRGSSVGELLEAYAAGVEAMGALTAASHPALYDGGWHPTAVAGGAGAAVAVARLLGSDPRQAAALALLRASGLRAAFGSDGKALQVGLAAASGVEAARLVAAGARVDAARVESGLAGFEEAFGARHAWPAPPAGPATGTRDDGPDGGGASAFDAMWIKAYPCCLQTHGAIECALTAREDGVGPGTPLTVVVHPVSRRAAALDDVSDGLQAKFSIPYLTALALRRGTPVLGSFAEVDAEVRADARAIRVRTDDTLRESEARLVDADGLEIAKVDAALGSPERPMTAEQLVAKVRGLAGTALDGLLDDPARRAADVADAVRAPT
jgi:2-methylcitrate dehydratase PrpD